MKILRLCAAAFLLLLSSPELARSARVPGSRPQTQTGTGAIKTEHGKGGTGKEQEYERGGSIKEPWQNRENLPPQLALAASQLKAASGQGVDDTATVFTQEAVQSHLPQLLAPADSEAPPLDLKTARLMARLTSAAYCSNKDVISTWTCTRCRRVPNFKPYQVSRL